VVHARERERERERGGRNMENACNILVKQIKERDHLEDLHVDGGITLRRSIVKLDMWM